MPIFRPKFDYRNWSSQLTKCRSFMCTGSDMVNFSKNCSTTSNRNINKTPIEAATVNYKSLTEFLWKDLHKWSSKVAIQCGDTGRKYTYADLRKSCLRFAKMLKKKGLRKGDIVSVVLPNIPEYPIILLGSVEAGLTVTTLNPNYTPAELSHQLADCKAVLIVTLTSFVGKVQAAVKIAEKKVQSEFAISVITLDDDFGSFSIFERMLNEHSADSMDLDNETCFNDVALIPYSSGTTGLPKGVQLTHSNLVHNLIQTEHPTVKVLDPTDGEIQDVVPGVIPFFHIFGLSALILSSFINGCKIVTLNKFNDRKYLNIIRNYRATILYLVPSLALFFNSCPLVGPGDLKNIRVSFCAGGSIPELEIEKLITLSDHKMNVKLAYGLTETSPAVCISHVGDPLNSCGQPLADTEVKIIDANGSSMKSYKRGEICIRGPQVMKGYFNNIKATADAIDKEGFFHSGDVGYYNDNKQFFCIDRIKELIKVKGFQVAPAELETILKSHRAVKDVGVVGVPDKRSGEKPIAFIVLESDQKSINGDKLKRFVAEKVAPYKQIANIVIVDEIPKNPSGKILRRILREMYKE